MLFLSMMSLIMYVVRGSSMCKMTMSSNRTFYRFCTSHSGSFLLVKFLPQKYIIKQCLQETFYQVVFQVPLGFAPSPPTSSSTAYEHISNVPSSVALLGAVRRGFSVPTRPRKTLSVSADCPPPLPPRTTSPTQPRFSASLKSRVSEIKFYLCRQQ